MVEQRMVERVARALAYYDYDTEDIWESYMVQAHAAIAAMRELSDTAAEMSAKASYDFFRKTGSALLTKYPEWENLSEENRKTYVNAQRAAMAVMFDEASK